MDGSGGGGGGIANAEDYDDVGSSNSNSHISLQLRGRQGGLYNSMIEAADELSTRHLNLSLKWLSEQIVGIDASSSLFPASSSSTPSTSTAIENPNRGPDYPFILLAKSLFASREYHRCFTTLLGGGGGSRRVTSKLGLFLGYYAMYMAGEKTRDQHNQEQFLAQSPGTAASSSSPSSTPKSAADKDATDQNSFVPNPLLSELKKELDGIYSSHNETMDGFLLYLYAVVIRDLDSQCGPHLEALVSLDVLMHPDKHPSSSSSSSFDNHELLPHHTLKSRSDNKALCVFMESLSLFPYNWSCWLELCSLLLAGDINLPSRTEFYGVFAEKRKNSKIYTREKNDADLDGLDVMYSYFYVHYHIERQNGLEALNAIDILYPMFPKSNVLLSQAALSHYAMRDYDKAQNIFETIRLSDPYRFEDIDTYSNILHVKEAKADLSFLAHMMAKIDKYSLEYCFVVGNYYSIKGQHEKAILYFHRALRINNRYLSAWTLMGHECINLKNTAAAVMCYRRAVELCGTDYRAWYGLGQTFEMLHMYQYALYYFQRAASIKPLDARNWCAVGICYLKLDQKHSAMQSFESAVNVDDREGIASRELAKMYKEFGNIDGAIACYIKQWMQWGYLDELAPSNANSANGGSSVVHSHNYRISQTFEKVEIDSTLASALLFATNYYYRLQIDLADRFAHQQQRGQSVANASHVEHIRYLTEAYASLLLDYIGPEGDEARAVLRSLRSRGGGGGGVGDAFQRDLRDLSSSHDDMSFDRGQNLSGSNEGSFDA